MNMNEGPKFFTLHFKFTKTIIFLCLFSHYLDKKYQYLNLFRRQYMQKVYQSQVNLKCNCLNSTQRSIIEKVLPKVKDKNSYFTRMSKKFCYILVRVNLWWVYLLIEAGPPLERIRFRWKYRGSWCTDTMSIASFKTALMNVKRKTISGTLWVWSGPWSNGSNQ